MNIHNGYGPLFPMQTATIRTIRQSSLMKQRAEAEL